MRYANALLPECLLAAGAMLNDTRFERTGLRLLDWLVAEETAPEGHFSFTPTHGWTVGEPRPAFDQQPIEAGAMADAAARAFTVTGEADWADVTIRSAEWFTGRNDLGVAMFDESNRRLLRRAAGRRAQRQPGRRVDHRVPHGTATSP